MYNAPLNSEFPCSGIEASYWDAKWWRSKRDVYTSISIGWATPGFVLFHWRGGGMYHALSNSEFPCSGIEVSYWDANWWRSKRDVYTSISIGWATPGFVLFHWRGRGMYHASSNLEFS